MHTNDAKPGLKIANDESLNGLPKYERLRNYIVSELNAGRLRPGDVLPTEHELAERASMSRNTARQALAQLEHNGVIRRVRGRGTFIHEAAMERLQSGLDVFALVIPQTRQGYYPSLQRGFHEASAGCRNQVIVCDTGNDPLRQADAFLQLLDKDVAGIALVPTTSPTTPAHQIRALRRSGIPVVFCHRTVDGVRAPLVTFSGLEVGRVAGTALLAHRHRRAAFLGSQRIGLSAQYEQGLREALEQGGGELPEQFVRYGDTIEIDAAHERFLESSLSAFLQTSDRPTAVFCTFDSEAEAVVLIAPADGGTSARRALPGWIWGKLARGGNHPPPDFRSGGRGRARTEGGEVAQRDATAGTTARGCDRNHPALEPQRRPNPRTCSPA